MFAQAQPQLPSPAARLPGQSGPAPTTRCSSLADSSAALISRRLRLLRLSDGPHPVMAPTAASGKLASLNRSWQSNKGTLRALGSAGIEPMPTESW